MNKQKKNLNNFEVTLAHKRSDRLDVTKGVFIQPKLDGVRCYTRLVDGEVKMFSRNHKEFKNAKHITTQLRDLFRIYPELILDGELYNHRYRDNFNEIISIVRTMKPTQADRFKSASYLQYHVYDMFDPRHPDSLYQNRLKWLMDNINGGSLKQVETKVVWSQEEVDKFEQMFLDQGYEGAMLRANEAYQQRRSHGLQKVKRFHDSEFTITGFIEGKGKFEKGLGKFLGIDENGLKVEVPYQKCTIEKRRKIWRERKSYLGKVATFEWFERTPAGAYRFPGFKGIRDYE